MLYLTHANDYFLDDAINCFVINMPENREKCIRQPFMVIFNLPSSLTGVQNQDIQLTTKIFTFQRIDQ